MEKMQNKKIQTRKRFFSLEGIDGSGKTTQMDLLQKALEEKGFSCLRIREPGGSMISERIRELLLDSKFKGLMADKAELLLYNAARAQIIEECIKPALDSGKIVLADRFAWSTYAYQGFGRNLDKQMIFDLSVITCGEFLPELTIVLDIDVLKSRERMAKENKVPDRLESEALSFFERVRQGYLNVVEEFPQHAVLVNADQSQEKIHLGLLTYVLNRLN